MNHLAKYLTKQLIVNEIIDSCREKEYIYGMAKALGKILNYSTIIVIAVYIDLVLPTLAFMIFFFSMRARTGGYHAKTEFGCYVGTVGSYLLVANAIAPAIVGNGYVKLIIVLLSALLILKFAPVNHPNLDLDEEEVQRNRILAIRILIFQMISLGLASILGLSMMFIAFAVSGMGTVATLILLAKVLKQEI